MTHSSALETLWMELVSRAVLGADRDTRPAEVSLAGEHRRLAVLLNGLQESRAGSPMRSLLETAAALAIYRLAGRLPQALAGEASPPSPADDLPQCPEGAARRLRAFLGGERVEALAEWLHLAAEAGLRLPAEMLPEALDFGRRKPKMAEAICAVTGGRGRWLAGKNPEWEYAASPGDPEEAWQTGDRGARRRALQRLRREWPQEGLRLLQSTWEQESAADRLEFTALMETGLSMDDEPFLEAALDDRSGPVRQAAAELLKRLPDARLVQRMIRRAGDCLLYESGRWPLSRGRLALRLPEKCDAGMRRDGVEPRPRAGSGERAGWLMQIIAAVPPQHWSRRWSIEPEELLLRLADCEWEALLIEAFCMAARRFPDPAWIRALLAVDGERPELIEALPPAEAEACLIDALRRRPNGSGLWMAARYSRTWSRELTAAVIEHLHRNAARLDSSPPDWPALQRIEAMGYCMHAGLLAEVRRWLGSEASPGSPLQKTFQNLIATLEFRQEMWTEFGIGL